MSLGSDPSYSGQSKIYRKQQPAGETLNGVAVITEEVFDAGSLLSHLGQETFGGVVQPAKASFTIAQDAAAGADVTIQLEDGAGNALAGVPAIVDVILSDSASGVGLTANAPSVGLTVGTPGTQLLSMVANKAVRAQCDANGQLKLVINDAAHHGYYVAVFGLPVPFVSRQLVAGDYK